MDPHPEDAAEERFASLFCLARRKAEDTRRVYHMVTSALFERRRALLSDRQRALMSNVMRQLVGDLEANLKLVMLSRVEEELPFAPAILPFLQTKSEGTFERLAAAGLFSTDLALIEAVSQRICEHHLDRLLKKAAPQSWIGEIGPAEGAIPGPLLSIRAPGLQERLDSYVVSRSRRADAYGDPVLDIVELEPELQARLHWAVGAILREKLRPLVASQHLGEVDALVENAVEDALQALPARGPLGTAAAAVADAVDAAGHLNCSLVLMVIRSGDIPLFEALLIRLMRLRPVLVRRLLYEPGGEGLAIAARAVGMRRDEFSELYSATRVARLSTLLGMHDHTATAVAFFDGIAELEAVALCAYWRRSPKLLGALWRLQTAEKIPHAEA